MINTGKIPDSPLGLLREGSSGQGGPELLLGAEGRWTWEDFRGQAFSLAALLRQTGLRPGQRVALICRGQAECFLLLFAAWAAGGVAAPLNISLPPAGRAAILDKLDPHLCVFGQGCAALDEGRHPSLHLEGPSGAAQTAFEPCRPRPQDPALIMFTSGTTGLPKGVVNSHWAVAANAWLTSQALGLRPDDRLLISAPAYYTSPIVHLLTMMAAGGSLAVHAGGMLFGEALLELMERHACTGFGGAPVQIGRILGAASPSPPAGLRLLVSSGDHLPPPYIQKCLDIWPQVRLHCIYGLSEVAGRLCLLPPEALPEKMGSVGKPLPGMSVTVRQEEAGRPADPGMVGAVYVQGPLVAQSYFRDGRSSADLHTPHGFYTGDYGYLDQDGFLFLRGRRDDIFKCGGEKVSTLLIQQALAGRPEFADLAVAPVADEVMGQVPQVFYVLRPGAVLDKRGLIADLKGQLPPNHIPARFKAVAQIPRTGTGKIIRRQMVGDQMSLAQEAPA